MYDGYDPDRIFHVEWLSEPDRFGRRHFALLWEQDGHDRAQHFHCDPAKILKGRRYFSTTKEGADL